MAESAIIIYFSISFVPFIIRIEVLKRVPVCKDFFIISIKRQEGMGGIPPPSAWCVMCITPLLMELWATLFTGCGKATFAFPCAVNNVVHSGMGSYAHFHDAFYGF